MKLEIVVTCISFSPDGQYLAAGDHEGHVGIWDLFSEEEYDLLSFKDIVDSVMFSYDGKFVVAGGNFKFAKIYDLKKKKIIREYMHNHRIFAVSCKHDGTSLALSTIGRVIIWNILTGKTNSLWEADEHVHSAMFSPDDRYVAVGISDPDIDLSWVSVRDIKKGRRKYNMHDRGFLWSVAFSPDGRYLLAGIGRFLYIMEWRKKKLITKIKSDSRSIPSSLWFKRFFAWNNVLVSVRNIYMEMKDGNVSMALSRRGFMAIGYENGTIEVIREGKVF